MWRRMTTVSILYRVIGFMLSLHDVLGNGRLVGRSCCVFLVFRL